jgi:fibronectin-binding autotransporter adhesin
MMRLSDTRRRLLLTGISLAPFLLAGLTARAGTFYWNSTGTSTWNSGTSWSTVSTGVGGTGAGPGSADTAFFNGSNFNGTTTAQLAGNQTVAGITVNNTGATTIDSTSSTAETLAIGTTGISVNAGSGALTIGNSSNTVNVTIGGSQSWANNSTSTMTVVNALSDTAASTLTFSGTGVVALNAAISNGTGALALTQSGTGTVVLGSSNSFTGATAFSSGGLTLTNGGALTSSALTVTASTGSTTLNLRSDSTGSFTVGTGTISISDGSSAKYAIFNVDETDGSGTAGSTLTLNALNFTAGTAPTAGTFSEGWGVTNGHNYNLTVSTAVVAAVTQSWANNMTNGTLTINTLNDANATSVRSLWFYGSNSSALTVIGSYNMTAATPFARSFQVDTAGTTLIQGASTATGALIIENGTWELGQETSLYNNTTASWINSTTTYGNTGAAGIRLYSGGTLALEVGGAANSVGDFTNSDIAILAPIVGTGTATLGLDTTPGNFTVTDTLTSSLMSLIKLGTNTLTLSGPNTFTGTVTVANGALSVGNFDAGGNIGSGASALILGGVQAGTGSLTRGVFSYTGGSDTFTRGFTVNAGASGEVDNVGTGALTIGTGAITGTGTFITGGAGGITIASNITHTGSFVDNNTGTVTFSGTGNTYGGGTTVNAGSLVIGSGSNLGSNSGALAVNSTGSAGAVSVTLGNSGLTTGNLSGIVSGGGNSATINNNGQLLTVNQTSNTTYQGAITGSGGFTYAGSGAATTLNLTGSNGYTGATAVNSGVLQISGVGSLGGTAVTVGNGGTLMAGTTGSSATTVIGTTGAGSLTISSGGNFSFSNGVVGSTDAVMKTLDINSNVSGNALTLNGGGSLSIGIGGAAGSDEIVIGNGASLTTSLSGTITVNLNLIQALNGTSQELIAYGTGGTTGSAVFSLGTVTGSTGIYSLSLVSNTSGLFLQENSTSFAYWKGAGVNSNWTTLNNFTTDIGGSTPRTDPLDSQTSVIFVATGGSGFSNTSLGADTTISSLTYNVGGVGISSGNTLTIASAGNALTVNTGVGSAAETIGANVAMGGSQTWTVTDANSTLAVSGNISGLGASLTKAGSGTLVLSGNNSYNGLTTVAGGYLNIQGSDALDGTASVTVNTGAALQMQGGVTTNNLTSLTINGNGPGTAGALESVDANGNSYTGAITLGSASSIGSDAGLFSLTGSTISDGAFTLTLVGAGNGYINDVISGSGGLTMNGTGEWSLDAANTYTGTTTVNSGTLQLGAGIANPNTPTFGAATNALAVNGGTVDLSAWNLFIGNLTGASGTITNSLAQEVVLTLGTSTNSSFGGSIVNGGGGAGIIDLVKQGSGTQTLTGSNSYTGPTTISGGALNIAGANALSVNSAVTVSTGGALQLSGNISTTAASLSLVGTGPGTSGALENFSGSNTYTGSITLAGNASIGADALSTLNLSTGGLGMNANNLTLVGAGTGTISDNITGTGNLVVNNTGTWTLSGSNAYTGTTSVTAGTLVYTRGVALKNSASINLGGTGSTTLNYAGAGTTMTTPMSFSGTGTATLGNIGTGSITYSGPLAFGSGNTTLALGNTTDTIGGTIGNITNGATGSVSLLKQGALNSTWILTGSNTYTGNTTITGGVLQVSSLPTGNVDLNGSSVSDYGVLQIVGTETLTNNLGSGAGNIQWLGNGGFSAVSGTMTLNLAGGQTLVWGGAANVNIGGNGGANIAFGSSTANGTIILQNSINFNSADDPFTQNVYVQGDLVIFQGALLNGTDSVATGTFNAAPGLNKIGSGTLVLTNSNSNYRGPTSVVGGTLVAEASSTITLANSTGSSTGVFGGGYGPITSNLTNVPAYVSIILGQSVTNGAATTGGVINPTLLVGSPTVGGSTSISNPISVDWNNGTGQVYGIGGYTDSNNTFAGLISLGGTPVTGGNTFAITQVATTGSDALNITGGITAAANGNSAGVGGNVNFANVGAVNVSTSGITNGTGTISVTQSGTGTTTFSAANTYTGSTTVNAGLLRINGSLVAGSAVTVNSGGALGGTGTISGAVTVNAGGSINLADGTIGTLTIGSLTLGTGSTAMTFDIGAGASNNLDLIAPGTFTINSGGTSAITIGFVSGSPLLTPGTYTLISGASASAQFSDFSLTDSQLGNYAFQLFNGGASGLQLIVTSNLAPTAYFYTGTVSTDFTDYHNFTTGASTGTTQTVGLTATSDVTIGSTSPTPANLTPVANSNVTIDSLTFASSGSGATLSGTGTVTIAATGNGGIGIADNAGIPTGTETISTALVLGGSQATQTWTASANSTLRVSGAISGSQSLALTGAGTYRLAGANTFAGLTVGTGSDTPSVYLANGTNGSATGTTTFTVQAGATLGGKGTSSGTSFSLAGTGTATGARVNILAGLISSTDTNTTGVLTLKGSVGTSSIADANLTFNLDAKSTSSTQINVAGTNVAFGIDSVGSVKLSLNMQNEPAIVAANTLYTLIAGTGSTSITAGSSTGQYTGLTLGTTINLGGGVTETVITGNNLQLAFGSSVDSSYYANSYLVLYQSAGVDDIDVVVVPEPGTWAMMLGGLAVLFFWQRRRSKA